MTRSVYSYAAEGGVPVGICLSAMSACFMLSLRYDSLLLLVPLLALVFPLLLLRTMRGMAADEPGYGKLSALWLCGIYSVIFGTLICSLFTGLWLSFVDPGFITAYVDNAISVLQSTPGAPYDNTVTVMQQAIERHLLPSGMELVASLGWTTCFAGSIVSLFLAIGIIVRQRCRFEKAFK